MARPPTVNAKIGATIAGIITLPRMPSLKKIASAPSATKTAPTIPPISAWDELDGRPKYHVIRFQAIAPDQPAEHRQQADRVRLTSTTSLATVAATSSEMNAPTKLRTAA